jgi:hypothetical protein
MSEVGDKSEQEQELRKRIVGSGDDSSHSKPGSLSPADSENEQRLGSDSDHVRKKFIDFLRFLLRIFCSIQIGLKLLYNRASS